MPLPQTRHTRLVIFLAITFNTLAALSIFLPAALIRWAPAVLSDDRLAWLQLRLNATAVDRPNYLLRDDAVLLRTEALTGWFLFELRPPETPAEPLKIAWLSAVWSNQSPTQRLEDAKITTGGFNAAAPPTPAGNPLIPFGTDMLQPAAVDWANPDHLCRLDLRGVPSILLIQRVGVDSPPPAMLTELRRRMSRSIH